MPQAVIAAIIGAAVSATQIGLQAAGVGQPARPKQPTPQPTGPTSQQVQAAVTPQALSIESLTNGSVSPDYVSTQAPLQAGVAGNPNTLSGVQAALQQILGNQTYLPGTGPTLSFQPAGQPVNLGSLAATPGTSDFLTKLIGGI